MIHNVKIDDSFPSGKKIIEDLRQHPECAVFEAPAAFGVAPEGYMTGDEFVKRGKANITQYYKDHGLL